MQSFREFLSADISTVLTALGVLVAMVFGVINAVRKTWQRILVIVIGVLILSLLLWNHYAMKRKNPPSDAYLSTSESSSNTSADGSLQP